MKTRRADVEIIYNGAAVTTKMLGQAGEVTYTDPACGEADSLDISINDRNRKWINAWLPVEGDTITATIRVYNWEREGDNRALRCGFFILDDFTFSGWPVAGNISLSLIHISVCGIHSKISTSWCAALSKRSTCDCPL